MFHARIFLVENANDFFLQINIRCALTDEDFVKKVPAARRYLMMGIYRLKKSPLTLQTISKTECWWNISMEHYQGRTQLLKGQCKDKIKENTQYKGVLRAYSFRTTVKHPYTFCTLLLFTCHHHQYHYSITYL